MSSQLRCFLSLIRREMILFWKEFFGKLIDNNIFLVTTVIVFGYFMSHSGLKTVYGTFIMIGTIASFGLFEVIWRATIVVNDITGDKMISNFLILPLSANYVFASIAIGWGLCTAIVSLCMFPMGFLILWDRFDFSQISLIKFCLIFIAGNLFFGFFALWLASLIKNMRNVSWIWARVVNPIFMFSCYFYSWKMVYQLSPWVAYVHLANPLVYVLEGTRSAIFGQSGYLPYWLCFFVLLAFNTFFAVDGIQRLKRRLDCV